MFWHLNVSMCVWDMSRTLQGTGKLLNNDLGACPISITSCTGSHWTTIRIPQCSETFKILAQNLACHFFLLQFLWDYPSYSETTFLVWVTKFRLRIKELYVIFTTGCPKKTLTLGLADKLTNIAPKSVQVFFGTPCTMCWKRLWKHIGFLFLSL